MRAVIFERPGDVSVLRIDEAPEPTAGSGQVVLAVSAAGVNRADLLQRRGLYPPPPGASSLLGLEVSGTVAAVGAGVRGWGAGDEAMALLTGGGYAERVAVDARHLLPIPGPVALTDAAALPEAFIVAWENLALRAGLRAGERVLIHGGSGGVGSAAIQVARRLGAEVWTTAGSPERAARCVGLGAHHAVVYRSEDFAPRLAAAGGADVILDVVGAKYLDANLRALATGGRLVIIGLQGGVRGEIDLGRTLSGRLTVAGSVLRGRSDDEKATLIESFRARMWPALDAGELRPVIGLRLPLEAAAEAHRRLAGGEVFGKIVLRVGPGARACGSPGGSPVDLV